LVVTGLFYPLYAALKGELLPGQGHVSLVGYAIVQLVTRQGTGSLFDPHSQTHAIVTAWLKLDPWLLGAALALSPIALARRSTRAVALAFLIQILLVLRPGYLPNMYVIGFLPFAALIVTGSIEALWRRSRLIARRAPTWLLAVVIGAPALAVAAVVAERWTRGDQVAMTNRVDGPTRSAERWLLTHVGRDKRLIVVDEFWLYLVEHGFDHRPQHGGFFSRTVVSYWPLDYDPAVKRHFPHGWRDFDYIVSSEAIRAAPKQTPTAAAALDHSRVVTTFGRGVGRIEIRAITGR
jgi:4-amino-4-deoxy-L-arabinose transferase-like glycosyltransferase